MTPAAPAPLCLPAPDGDWAAWLRDHVDESLAAVEAGAAQVRSARTDTMSSVEVVAAWDETRRRLGLATGATELLASVHPDPAVRALADELARRAARVATELGQDEQVYRVLSSLPTAGLSEQARRLLAHELRDLRRNGIGLDDDDRAALRRLVERETQVCQDFDNRVRDDVRTLSVHPDRLGGLPRDWVDAHPVADDGTLTLTTDYPDLQPVLTFAEDRSLRAGLRALASRRGWPENEPVLAELLDLRTQRARLLGHDDWPSFDAETKMIGTSRAIADFVERGAEAVRAAAAAEHDRLLARLRQDVPDAETLTEADVTYYLEVLRREEHDVDAQQVRRYLDVDKVRAGVLDVTSRLFGLTITEVPEAPRWHEDVRCYDVAMDGEPLGRFHLDLFPRDGKFQHAAHFTLVTGVEGRALPQSVLVCNFPRGLMEHRQVTTFFHEFGHLVHALVAGRGPYARFGGVATEWDFVEAPSQMLEEWAWDPAVLASFATDEDGAPIPAALVARMREARDLGRALHVAAQMYYAAVSYWFHAAPQDDLDAQRRALRSRLYRPAELPDTHMHTSFGHLSGYTSAYYTYMWSLVIAKDLFSAFDGQDLMDPDVARRYRETVLAPGGSRDAADLVRDFLGRPYDERAFTAWLTD